jgi:demethylmenaquinone methyltransferase / 2-methoxy-6-polyprenyl-1,4-benzoquinol methylase
MSVMIETLDKTKLKEIYDKRSSWYDLYHNWATFKADEFGRKLVVQNSVESGDTVLDAGSGTGSTALIAAEKTGPDGKIVLFDISDGMINIAKKKIEAARFLDRIETKIGDILNLPFADNSFDVVLSTYSVCPLYSPEKGVLELLRVVKPGGKLAVAHSSSPENPLLLWLSEQLEKLIWLFPKISLGCRSVSTLPVLLKAGTKILFKRKIGFPLLPFIVFVVEKPVK